MSNFVNLLDIIYPVNSIYITTSTISPATSIGGTWTQITNGACIAAYEDTSGYTGSKKITVEQIPPHRHSATNKPTGGNNTNDFPQQWGGAGLDYSSTFITKYTNDTGGGARLLSLFLCLPSMGQNCLNMIAGGINV